MRCVETYACRQKFGTHDCYTVDNSQVTPIFKLKVCQHRQTTVLTLVRNIGDRTSQPTTSAVVEITPHVPLPNSPTETKTSPYNSFIGLSEMLSTRMHEKPELRRVTSVLLRLPQYSKILFPDLKSLLG